jgi:hypothetical protein
LAVIRPVLFFVVGLRTSEGRGDEPRPLRRQDSVANCSGGLGHNPKSQEDLGYVPRRTLAENGLQVFLCGLYGHDVEVVHEYLQEVRREEGREAGADADVLDAEGEQGEKHGDRFLFVPGENDGERQRVDVGLERAGERDRYLDGRVGVVALADVEQARDAFDVAELEPVELELAAGEGEDDRVLPAFTRSITLPATDITALWPKPTRIVFSGSSAG